jgi:hypothetical protein
MSVTDHTSSDKEERLFHSLFVERQRTAPHISHYLSVSEEGAPLEEQLRREMELIATRLDEARKEI